MQTQRFDQYYSILGRYHIHLYIDGLFIKLVDNSAVFLLTRLCVTLSVTRACSICLLIVYCKHIQQHLLNCLYRK